MHAGHPWMVVGPWYRWREPNVASSGRAARPVIQKYDTPELVKMFLEDPQRSLKYVNEDFVHHVVQLPAMPLAGGLMRRLSNIGRSRTDRRKIFLEVHKRFYLVVCEVHCDAAGFPNVSPDDICEAGFVVRRRVALLAPALERDAREIVQRVSSLSAQLAQL